MAAHATADDMIARHDVRILGELAGDNNVVISRVALKTDDTFLKGGLAASGELETNLTAGGRYSVADLGNLSENSREHMKDIVCTFWMAWLFRRRPGAHKELAKEIREQALAYQTDLAAGKNVLGIVDDTTNIEAGKPDYDFMSVQSINTKNTLTSRMAGRHLTSEDRRVPGRN